MIFFIAVCLVLAGVTIAGKDFWPFSHYPMFSVAQKTEELKVWRIALEDTNGNIEWWQSKFFRYPEFSARKLQKIYGLNIEGNKLEIFVNIERNKLLKAVMKNIQQEQPKTHFSAIHIIERSVTPSFKVNEKTIDIIPLTLLQNGSN